MQSWTDIWKFKPLNWDLSEFETMLENRYAAQFTTSAFRSLSYQVKLKRRLGRCIRYSCNSGMSNNTHMLVQRIASQKSYCLWFWKPKIPFRYSCFIGGIWWENQHQQWPKCFWWLRGQREAALLTQLIIVEGTGVKSFGLNRSFCIQSLKLSEWKSYTRPN